jgi:hypothetical protein
MTLCVTPEHGVPLTDQEFTPDLLFRLDAANGTTALLAAHGLEIDDTTSADDAAAKLVLHYAENATEASEKTSDRQLAALPPGALTKAYDLLKEFSHPVVQQAIQIRHLVVNKLIIETDNPSAQIRIRALELLGKVSDVGLFSEKSDITVTHRTEDDLRNRLREKLTRLVHPGALEEPVDGEFTEILDDDAP